MFRGLLLALIFLGGVGFARASYLDENPDEVFAGVYTRLGISLPHNIARDPQVWVRLDELKREPCDQKSIDDLALLLEKLGYRRQAAEGQYNFVKACGEPILALHKSINMLLKLSDYALALEVADDFMRRAPTNHNAHYLRGVALEGIGDYRRALVDYTNAIELFGADRTKINSGVFLRMANAYAKLGQFCEAATPILTWIAIDPVRRDNSRTQKIITDYENQGNCAASAEFQKERYALRGANRVVTARADVNGVNGVFIIDTGASYVSIKPSFASRAKIPFVTGSDVRLATANGMAKGKLSKADTVSLGKLKAKDVPVVVQGSDDNKTFGAGVDGLLGMSFLSRFEIQVAGGFIEIRSRRRR
jgi:aspartyl protease family protein